MRKAPYILLLAALTAMACTPETTCHVSTESRMRVGIVGDTLDLEGKIVNYALDSLTIVGVGQDSILFDNIKLTKSYNMPLRPDQEEAAFAICYHNYWDTLKVTYTNHRRFISLACGESTAYTLKTADVTPHGWVDSVCIVSTDIDITPKENIVLYIHGY
ncbi:MAG: DUF6452 family protein [Paludibacteraceae bacterium]|nr:DUF6452 family protein [Paludibacteraceae bacterium]